jgi:peptide/nickel transport system substrate-binding protein
VEELLSQTQIVREKKEAVRGRIFTLLALISPLHRRIFFISGIVFLVTSFVLLTRINERFLVEVPRHGGMLTEGIIGRPRFVNPIIAKSDADRDLSALIYSGLLRATSDGKFIPDLALLYDVSPDGLTYTFTLRSDLVWHDGEPITSGDIAFTIEKVRDQGLAIKSPRRASWDGVEVETPDPLTVIFHIKQPYAPFLENTTMGILPKHIWSKVPNDEFDVSYYNITPIGSGPYRVSEVVQDNDKGLPKYYDLVAFKRYVGGEPYISNLRIVFFGNNKELASAYLNKDIDQMHTIEPALAEEFIKNGASIARSHLPRVFAAYFNQNQQHIFADSAVRKALLLATDKEAIVRDVLFGYGRAIDGPLPEMMGSDASTTIPMSGADRITGARKILEDAGWTPNALGIYEKVDKKKKVISPLEFSISIPDVPELKNATEMLRTDWEKIGARVTIKTFELSTFSNEVLSPRKYDVLFFGQIIGRTPDLFSYWHSSQRFSPGLNVALYANKKVDTFLEDARKERDDTARATLLASFVREIKNDVPAIFVYSPDFLYATGANVHGIQTGLITTESERFLDIANWYTESEYVWKWFRDTNRRLN